jgi:formyltetrahydrofolate deformylase
MIGATAHFVTPDLDEGPIISQGVEAIRHDMRVENVVDVGRDIERRTLANAVRLYTQRRVLLNGSKTVVFE